MNDPNVKHQVYILMGSLLPEAIIESMLIPIYPYIVSHLLGKESHAKGFYTGLFSSAFYTPLFIMNIVWGSVSDRIGRKPVLLLGLIIGASCCLTLSFSQTYTLSIFARFLSGVFGSNSTVAKGMIGDLLQGEENIAWGYSTYGSVYGFSGIFGPLLTSILYNPSVLYPFWFDSKGFFGKRPYALPCLVGFILTLIGLYTTHYYLYDRHAMKGIQKKKSSVLYRKVLKQEDDEVDIEMIPSRSTSSNGKKDLLISRSSVDYNENRSSPSDIIYNDDNHNDDNHTDDDKNSNMKQKQDSKNGLSFKLFAPIFLYCTMAFCSMNYMTAIPIYMSASIKEQGLGLSPQQTSLCTMVISMVKFPLQLYGFQKCLVYFKNLSSCYRTGMILLIPVHLLLPWLSLFPFGFFSWMILMLSMVLVGIAEVLCFLSAIVMITETTIQVHGSTSLGFVHGLASTLSALVRSLSPPISGLLWELGKSPFVFGMNGLFVLCFGVCFSLFV